MVVLCMLSVLPWIGLGDFSTKGEPREAAVAVSMLETGNWVLPQVYADEFAYKPPMAHWLMAAFSYPQGYVSEFTSRLPSALAFIVLMGFVLVFFGKRIVKFQEAFIATLLLLTCVEIHRAAMTTRVDMLLTTFMVLGLFQLYRWEDKLELKGLPIFIPILFGCAILTKGPVGVILPLFVFGVYLFVLNRYSLLTIFKALLYAAVSSLFLPMLWYVAAWKQGGDEFLNVVLAENFARFFHLSTPALDYHLGHENGVWYNVVTLLGGFIPWTIFFFFTLFGMKWRMPSRSLKEILSHTWQQIRSMEKVRLFSLVAIVCIFVFYSIPSSKRSVYLMPAYPFIALFLAQYTLYITEYRTKVTRVFAAFLAGVVGIAVAVLILTMRGIIHPAEIARRFTTHAITLHTIETVTQTLTSPSGLSVCILIVTLVALITVFYQMSKKINIKILYATIALTFCINLLIDGVIMPGIRKSGSSRFFAERISKTYSLDNRNMYVMNNLKNYRNLYGLNFYLGNRFHNFEKEMPRQGYFLSGEKEMEKVEATYGDRYTFQELTATEHPINEVRQRIVLTRFEKK